MARFCRFWRMVPADYWALTYAEYRALEGWMDAEHRHNKRMAQKQKQRANRKR